MLSEKMSVLSGGELVLVDRVVDYRESACG